MYNFVLNFILLISLLAPVAVLSDDKPEPPKPVEVEKKPSPPAEADKTVIKPSDAEAKTPKSNDAEKKPSPVVEAKPFRDCPHCPEMVTISGGSFRMGTEEVSWKDEKPEHEVTLKSFAMGRYEVTFEEYDRFVDATNRVKPNDAGWGRGRRPVINVSWEDAVAYTKWLSQQAGKPYHLPTEAQWEYAARAGSQAKWHFGYNETLLVDYAWYINNADKQTHPVGEKQPNAFGLYDMLGNVWEWVEDVYHSDYKGAPTDGSAWMTSAPDAKQILDTTKHVLRGCAWGYSAHDCRVSNRIRQTNRLNNEGFRVCTACRN